MTIKGDTWDILDAGPFSQATLGNPIDLWRDQLGFDPTTIDYVTFQCTGLGGGTVDIYVYGPAGTWAKVVTGAAEDDIATVGDQHVVSGYRFDFVGGAGTGMIYGKAVRRGY